ncbi:MAG: glycosyltransferase family 39 protein, partial [Acidimicrobiales bacterium]
TAEITPPFSFVLSWLTSRLGNSPELIRLPALVAGIATVPLVYKLGLRTVGRRGAVLAAALTALSPFMILYSAEARGYGVLMALLVVSTLTLLLAVDEPRRLWWVVYAACACLAMYTHYTSIFVLFGQVVWAWTRHPEARRPLVLANVAAVVLYLPWLPSLRGDLDSPTTAILSAFSPLSVDMVRVTLGHWSVGFPYAFPTTTLNDLPGLIPLLMLLVAVALGARGAIAGERPGDDRRSVLVAILAAATPIGTFVQSVVSTNVFSVRSLGASWPYLALITAWLIVSSGRRVWAISAALAVGAFAVGAVTMLGATYDRPAYGPIADFADEHDAAVIVDGLAFPPGPLTNLNVEETRPRAPLLRLSVPAQLDRPFGILDTVEAPEVVFERAAAMADGGPIVVTSLVSYEKEIDDLIATLPEGYEVTDEIRTDALWLHDLRAVLLERS